MHHENKSHKIEWDTRMADISNQVTKIDQQ